MACLYVLATPIGNLGDITQRAAACLRTCKFIYAEDTRRSRILLEHLGCQSADYELRSLHAHNEYHREQEVSALLASGCDVALLTDAGTPGVSDPGAILVDALGRAGYRVSPLPGPSALTAALSVAGFSANLTEGRGNNVLFMGFLPPKGALRLLQLEELQQHVGLVVLFEAPHRLQKTLQELAKRQGERCICVCRELTKLHEEVQRGTLTSMEALFAARDNLKGEFTLVLAPYGEQDKQLQQEVMMTQLREEGEPELALGTIELIDRALTKCLAAGLSKKEAIKAVSAIFALAKKAVYSRAEKLKEHLPLWLGVGILSLVSVLTNTSLARAESDIAAFKPPAEVALKQNVEPAVKAQVLLTHPVVNVLKDYQALLKAGLLDVAHLHLVGVYHAEETDDYASALAFIKEQQLEWITLKKISCSLPRDKVFRVNDCTPIFKDLFQHSAGVILNGGADIPPGLYGAKTHLLTQLRNEPRHYFELSLLAHLLGNIREPGVRPATLTPWLKDKPNYLVLGICLGMQSLNVATGGTLIQDILSEVYKISSFEDALKLPLDNWHQNFWARLIPVTAPLQEFTTNTIIWQPEAPLVQALRRELPTLDLVRIYSNHHQALKTLGKDLQIVATSKDHKIAEAIVHKNYPHVLGVQFHPEKYFIWQENTLPPLAVKSNFPELKLSLTDKAFHQAFWRYIWSLVKTTD